jgi:hypothetical protein
MEHGRDYLTLAEAAAALGLSSATLRVVGHHHAGGQLELRWRATSSSASGWSEDRLPVDVEPEPVTTDLLMARADADEEDRA